MGKTLSEERDMRQVSTFAALAFTAVLAAPSRAQNDKMTPIAAPSQPDAIELGTGPLPGATNPESWHSRTAASSRAT